MATTSDNAATTDRRYPQQPQPITAAPPTGGRNAGHPRRTDDDRPDSV